jgi:hypothetical protein
MMFEFFTQARKKRLSFAQLQTIQRVAQQVVLSVEGSVRIPGAAKKALALKLVGNLLEELGIVAPDSLIDTSIEVSVRLLKALDAQATPEPPEPHEPPRAAVHGRPRPADDDQGISP